MATPHTEKTLIPIGELVGWTKNPRSMGPEDKERLKRQLVRLGQYKPLIATHDGGFNVVLGGNMRLAAMQDLHAEGNEDFAKVWVSFVDAPDDKKKLEYALSDNDRAGQYDEAAVAKMVKNTEGFEMEDFHIDTNYNIGLDTLVERYDLADIHQGPDTGPRDVSTVKEKRISYDNATIKQIVMYFDAETYARVMNDLQEIMAENPDGVESNTEAVLWLINFWRNVARTDAP